MLEEYSLNGKVAIVTGAGSPLGKAIAIGLSEAGASVVAVARDERGARGTAEEIARAGGKAVALAADVRSEAEAQKPVDRAMAEYGRVDILVNGEEAGFGKSFLETSLDEWRKVFDANVTSVFLSCKAAVPAMARQGKGKIINVSSALAVRAVVGGAAYCATKGAISQLTQALSLELGPNQISINSVAPGWFAEGPVDRTEDLAQPLVRMIPQRRRGQPEDIAGLVVYLASEAGDYVTGQTIVVDGAAQTHG